MKKYLFILIALCLVVLPGISLAQITVESMAMGAVRTAWIVATAVVVVMWIVTGILFLSSAGDPARVGTAKKALFAAIIGTVVVIIANSAMGLISNAIGG